MSARKSNTPPVRAGCQGASQVHPVDTGGPLAIATCGTSIPDAGDLTPPRFDCLPPELTTRPRWVLWRDGKVPYCALQPRKRASCTDPKTWASFDAALAARNADGDCGLGFVLGDGIAAVDIDHDTSEAAMFMLETVGCGYIEVSPSGEGLHGWALSDATLPRKKGVLDGLHVEVYNAERYITVTGHHLVNEPLRRTDRILRLSMALARETQEKPTGFTASTASTASTADHVEVLRALEVSAEFLPKKTGERNSKLFEWCRYVKTVHPDATVAERVGYARQWYRDAQATVATKDPSVTINDFLRGWEVAQPIGFDVKGLIAEAGGVPVPDLVESSIAPHVLAYQLCVLLQRQRPDKPFFISTRQLGECLGTSHTIAARVMDTLRRLDVLAVAKQYTRTTSTRYYVAPQFLDYGNGGRDE